MRRRLGAGPEQEAVYPSSLDQIEAPDPALTRLVPDQSPGFADSLLYMVFQQRNGRVDRYGQPRTLRIVHLVTESANETIRGDSRILEVLERKDEQAYRNVGDPPERKSHPPRPRVGRGHLPGREIRVVDHESELEARFIEALRRMRIDRSYRAIISTARAGERPHSERRPPCVSLRIAKRGHGDGGPAGAEVVVS